MCGKQIRQNVPLWSILRVVNMQKDKNLNRERGGDKEKSDFFSDANVSNSRKTLVSILVILFAVFLSAFVFNLVMIKKRITTLPVTHSLAPKKTVYKNILPPGFPKVVPIESGVTLSQSYTKEYQNQLQMSVLFPSQKSVSENYLLYKSFLLKDGWTLSQSVDGPKRYYLYAKKDNYILDVMILKNQATSTQSFMSSYVSLTLLKNN